MLPCSDASCLEERDLALPPEVEMFGESACPVVLETPLTRERCTDFHASRQYVMCKAHSLIREGKPFREAIKMAWEEIRGKCVSLGVKGEEQLNILGAFALRRGKNLVGLASLDDAGRVTLCLGNHCLTTAEGEREILPITIGLMEAFGLTIEEVGKSTTGTTMAEG